MRAIKALDLPDIQPERPAGSVPGLRMVAPTDLMVDGAYQRNLSRRSVALIRKIAMRWDWWAFKPPVVTEASGGLHVLDGQHTAIAAATCGLEAIPVFVVETDAVAERARAFVAHNADRIAATPAQIFHAQLAAGDETALTIQAAAERAGVTILKNPPPRGVFRAGETIAIATLKSIEGRRHAAGLRRVMQVCGEARLAPVAQWALRAVEYVMFDEAFRGLYADASLVAALLDNAEAIRIKGEEYAAARRLPNWRGAAIVLAQRARKRRRSGDVAA